MGIAGISYRTYIICKSIIVNKKSFRKQMNPGQEIVLQARNLSKKFEGGRDNNVLWALKDVNFELAKGEILGVIGRNGAGKSTLLKVLSQITSPTDGEIEYEGILTSIIEIGTGFHEDLSGRENVFLSGSIMGLSKKEIKKNYKKIVAFSELEEFMDMPVKYYSSGMYLRLAFSVAFHASVDILLLDEVLAVGDVDFRRKCYDRIRELRDNGASILIVSHNLEQIVQFCDRCIFIDSGEIRAIGHPLDIIEKYIGSTNKGQKGKNNPSRNKAIDYLYDFTHLELKQLFVKHFEIKAYGKNKYDDIYMSDAIEISIEIEKKQSNSSIEIGYVVTNMNDQRVFLDSYGLRENYTSPHMDKGEYTIKCKIPKNLLNRGIYSLGILINENRVLIKEIDPIARFTISPRSSEKLDLQISTIIRPRLEWKIKFINKE
jgi:lipopolysaccharide transport system ATP-binding protein